MLKSMSFRTTLVAIACAISMSAHAMADEPKKVDIPAGDLRQALLQLSKQYGADLVYRPEQLTGLKTHGAHGELTTKQAVSLLLEGTPLELRTDPSGAMLIAPAHTLSLKQGEGSGREDPPEGAHSSKSSSGDRRQLAQANQGQTSSPATVEKEDQQASKKKPVQLEEVIVTGSRIPTHAKEGAQDVQIYTREKIEQSGQTTVVDFLNTLPAVSTASSENGGATPLGTSTVTLHGLPFGTTLVLINGRRVETSGINIARDIFDLSNISLAAVDRIEVMSTGSSAVYGSDAIAGVVNIVLKKDFSGLAVDTKYAGASGTHEWEGSFAWGKQWGRASASVIASYMTRSALLGSQRPITATNDYTPFGGTDQRGYDCNPGNVFFPNGFSFNGQPPVPYAAVPAGYTGTPTVQEFAGTAGTLNKCSFIGYYSVIPAARRKGVFAQGSYRLTSSVELFTELLLSAARQSQAAGPPELFGEPGFQSFTVPASNPFNPFGQDVGVSNLLTTLGSGITTNDTVFFRPLLGAKGDLFGTRWQWEFAGWASKDWSKPIGPTQDNTAIGNAINSTNPATALNPFIDGAQASPALLRSFLVNARETFYGHTLAVSGFVRGPLLQLKSGPLEVVFGGEHDRDRIHEDDINLPFESPNTITDFQRHSSALFTEGRVPILGHRANPQAGDILVVTLASRYDSYSDFGSKTTPQFGAEWRPSDTLLVRGTYGRAFKAPSLNNLYQRALSLSIPVFDPVTGQTEVPSITFGGNRNLRPETGQSRTFGIVYSSEANPGLRLSVTHWDVDEKDSIQFLVFFTIIANESLFPGNITRAPGQNGQPGPITAITDTFVNFGEIRLSGFDYQVAYKYQTGFGELTPSLSAVQTYHYTQALTPGSPPVDSVSKANSAVVWAPRWKGTVATGWKLGPLSANVAGRYISRYQDYAPLANGSFAQLGDSWFWDANFHYEVGGRGAFGNRWLNGAYMELGGVNLLNRLPKYSNFGFGYDPTQADIRGRFLYARLGINL